MLTGILAPMPEEIDLILADLKDTANYESGRRKFVVGKIGQHKLVVALSRVGKVAAAVTAAIMIEKFKVDQLILTGVAGAVAQDINVGDIVIATSSVQHDLDARPLFPRFEAPLLGQAFFECDTRLVACAKRAAEHLLKSELESCIDPDHIKKYRLSAAKVYTGLICCGDQFITSQKDLDQLRAGLPNALCVEMECGAVGQVCYEYGTPYVVLRSVSDSADHNAHVDFTEYIQSVSRPYTHALIRGMLGQF